MTKIFNTRLLALLYLVLVFGIGTSCEKDDEESSGIVQLLSFGPTGANHGDTLRFIGNNLSKVTSIELTGATVAQSDFLQQTNELIFILVPDATEKGFIKLKTPDGDIVSKTQLNLGVESTVTTFTPEARPGENITITGDFLNWVQRITFANDKHVEIFVSKSLNQLVVTVPEDAQTGPLILFYGGTDSMEVQTDDTLKVILPMATDLSPNPIKHADNLTITGTNMDLVKEILFTGVATGVSAFESQSLTEIVVKVPGATQKGKLTFVAASGEKTMSEQELDLILPSVTTIAPNPVDPGADITITGTNLDLVTSITFDNAPAVTNFVSQSATQIIATVPMGVLRGKITLGILNSTVIVQSADILEITGSVPPPTIAFPFYMDAVTSNWTSTGWIGGGWGGTKDYDNTSPVREGTKSIKVDYVGSWGSPFQLGGATIDVTPYTALKLSIYGGTGSNGKKVNIGINGSDTPNTITLVEGVWTDYSFPISSLNSGGVLKEIIVKEYNDTGGFTIYLDAIGLN